jgi:PTS system ascorbate-specific IIA component
MGVALLLITHDNIGSSMYATAENMMGVSPINTRNLVITSHMDIEQGYIEAEKMCTELDEGDGILILTDIYGSTPSNIATQLQRQMLSHKMIIVTGMNLPMLVRIMNYAHLALPELAQKAGSSASDTIMIIDKPIDCDESC